MTLTQEQLTSLIAEAQGLRLEIAAKERRLKEIEAMIKLHAKTLKALPLKDADREGTRQAIETPAGTLSVNTTADTLMSRIPVDSPAAAALLEICGAHPQFKTLFGKTTEYVRRIRDGKQFRETAVELLGAKDGTALIGLLTTTKTKTVVDWGHVTPNN